MKTYDGENDRFGRFFGQNVFLVFQQRDEDGEDFQHDHMAHAVHRVDDHRHEIGEAVR